jgi:hypothetical protein
MNTDEEEPFDPASYVPRPTNHFEEEGKSVNFQLWVGGIALGLAGLAAIWSKFN